MTCFPLQFSRLARTSIRRSVALVRSGPPLETAIAPLRERRKDRQRRRQSSLSVMTAGDQACPETRPCPHPSSGSRKPTRTLVGKADDTDVLLANVESQHRHAAQLNTHAHPFVERLIGTVRREYLDHILFWTTTDLENKLLDFRTYFNDHRTHTSREGRTPDTPASRPIANLRSFGWQPHCRSLFQTPMAA
jgi:Integrase core domain